MTYTVPVPLDFSFVVFVVKYCIVLSLLDTKSSNEVICGGKITLQTTTYLRCDEGSHTDSITLQACYAATLVYIPVGLLLLGRVHDASLHALALLLLCGQQVSVLHQGLPGQQLLFLNLRKLTL